MPISAQPTKQQAKQHLSILSASLIRPVVVMALLPPSALLLLLLLLRELRLFFWDRASRIFEETMWTHTCKKKLQACCVFLSSRRFVISPPPPPSLNCYAIIPRIQSCRNAVRIVPYYFAWEIKPVRFFFYVRFPTWTSQSLPLLTE